MTANPTVVSNPSTPVNVLARYSIPLGDNEATLEFTGKSLSPEDFDALIEYVELFKKQFERRQQKEHQADQVRVAELDAQIRAAAEAQQTSLANLDIR